MSAEVVLEFDEVTVGYGDVAAVRGLAAQVRAGEILALLGPNGAGKTTSLLAAVGALPLMGGQIRLFGEPIDTRIERNAGRGITLVPDTRGVFHGLTVAEHLRLARRRGGPDTDMVFGHFPALADLRGRRCGSLSGGEQQMLALGKALLAGPRVLLIDELSMGLAPIAVKNLLPRLRAVADEADLAVVLVEQHIDLALGIADHAMVMHHGRVALSAPAAELRADRDRVEAAYFGTHAATGSDA